MPVLQFARLSYPQVDEPHLNNLAAATDFILAIGCMVSASDERDYVAYLLQLKEKGH
jgi:hypothetical protein